MAGYARNDRPAAPPTDCPAEFAGVAQLVEHQPSKLRVAGSSPVARLWMERGSSRDAMALA
jgi:hypothetical protein